MKIGIFGSDYQSEKQKNIRELFEKLRSFNSEIWVEAEFYNYLSMQFAYTPQISGLIESEEFPLGMVISLGGDGTFLRTAAWVRKQNIPILGINTGRLGFLSDINADVIGQTLDEIFRGDYYLEKRSLLKISSKDTFLAFSDYALNEIAILKRDTSSMITIHTSLNNDFLTNYLADGLLIATPTGSTAYSLSVNGPIILPQANNFVLTPVAPHSLTVRPLVIPEDYEINIEVTARSKDFLVAIDGRSKGFPSPGRFQVKKATFSIPIVKRFNHTFYDTLRKKLLWGTDIRKT